MAYNIKSPLSDTTKMPCPSWGISARHCQVGGVLALQPGTPCSHCYAVQGHFLYSVVNDKLERNLQQYLDSPTKWVETMVHWIVVSGNQFFRFFHAGDFQSVQMIEKVMEVAIASPKVRFWITTQERKMILDYLKQKGIIPVNVSLRVSSPLLNVCNHPIAPETGTSFVFTSEVRLEAEKSRVSVPIFRCPAQFQDGNCGTCRACWYPQDYPVVAYPLKIGGIYLPKKHQ